MIICLQIQKQNTHQSTVQCLIGIFICQFLNSVKFYSPVDFYFTQIHSAYKQQNNYKYRNHNADNCNYCFQFIVHYVTPLQLFIRFLLSALLFFSALTAYTVDVAFKVAVVDKLCQHILFKHRYSAGIKAQLVFKIRYHRLWQNHIANPH